MYTSTYSFFILCIMFHVDSTQTQLRPSCRTTHKVIRSPVWCLYYSSTHINAINVNKCLLTVTVYRECLQADMES